MRTDEKILKAAIELFRERGFHGVGVAEIGRTAGVTGPAIYKHFSSKDEILAALFELAMRRVLMRVRLDAADPWERLDAMVGGMVVFSREDRDLVLIYAREQRFLVDPWRRSVRRQVDEHLAQWQAIVLDCRPGLDPVDAMSVAWALNEMLLSIAAWPRVQRESPGLHDLVRSLARGAVRDAGRA